MARYQDQVFDEYNRPVPAAQIYVFLEPGDLAPLTDDLALPLANPVLTDADGIFYFNAAPGQYELEVRFSGDLEYKQTLDLAPSDQPIEATNLVFATGPVLFGKSTAGPGAGEELTGAQATALLSTVTAGVKGLAPAGGGATTYLRGDGAWAIPATSVGSVAWGAITGALSAQADLQAALNAKVAKAGDTMTGDLAMTKVDPRIYLTATAGSWGPAIVFSTPTGGHYIGAADAIYYHTDGGHVFATDTVTRLNIWDGGVTAAVPVLAPVLGVDGATGTRRPLNFYSAGTVAASISLQTDNVSFIYDCAVQHNFSIGGAIKFAVAAAGVTALAPVTVQGTLTVSGGGYGTIFLGPTGTHYLQSIGTDLILRGPNLKFARASDGGTVFSVDSNGNVYCNSINSNVPITVGGLPLLTTPATRAVVNPASVTVAAADGIINITGLAQNLNFLASGVPYDGQRFILRVKDNGSSRAITFTDAGKWRTLCGAISGTTPNKMRQFEIMYHATDARWDIINQQGEF